MDLSDYFIHTELDIKAEPTEEERESSKVDNIPTNYIKAEISDPNIKTEDLEFEEEILENTSSLNKENEEILDQSTYNYHVLLHYVNKIMSKSQNKEFDTLFQTCVKKGIKYNLRNVDRTESKEKEEDFETQKLNCEPNNKYSCNICPRTFKQKSNLDRHKLVHSSEKPYTCPICKKTFREKGGHIRVHTGEKPYQCNICERQFSNKSNLNVHIAIHLGEEPKHACDICKKAFRSRSLLNRHQVTHRVERPYACKYCDKKFRSQDARLRHSNIHIKEETQLYLDQLYKNWQ